jgi:hypothetical protein
VARGRHVVVGRFADVGGSTRDTAIQPHWWNAGGPGAPLATLRRTVTLRLCVAYVIHCVPARCESVFPFSPGQGTAERDPRQTGWTRD